MKSFADWTDEIRALMNPPKPMVDRCNWTDDELNFYSGDQWPKTIGFDVAEGKDRTAFITQFSGEPLLPWQQEYMAAALAKQGTVVARGRRTGKSWLTQQMMEALAKHGEFMYECTPTGRIKPISTNEMLKRGYIAEPKRTQCGYDKVWDDTCRECRYLNFGCGAHEKK